MKYRWGEKPSVDDQVEIFRLLGQELDRRLKQKGDGPFASMHEALGAMTEEYFELVEAVHSDTDDLEHVHAEMLDIAVAAVWALASIRAAQNAGGRK